jgi:methylthioribose-1-phosphate isomerase
MIDQRDLPATYEIVQHTTLESVINSIKIMLVRGAPAIGAAGAFGMVLAAISSTATTSLQLLEQLKISKHALDDSRPTAVNLSWATARIVELVTLMHNSNIDIKYFRERILHEAQELADDDVRINKRLGDFGTYN